MKTFTTSPMNYVLRYYQSKLYQFKLNVQYHFTIFLTDHTDWMINLALFFLWPCAIAVILFKPSSMTKNKCYKQRDQKYLTMFQVRPKLFKFPEAWVIFSRIR